MESAQEGGELSRTYGFSFEQTQESQTLDTASSIDEVLKQSFTHAESEEEEEVSEEDYEMDVFEETLASEAMELGDVESGSESVLQKGERTTAESVRSPVLSKLESRLSEEQVQREERLRKMREHQKQEQEQEQE
jgi:hypothetical protein